MPVHARLRATKLIAQRSISFLNKTIIHCFVNCLVALMAIFLNPIPDDNRESLRYHLHQGRYQADTAEFHLKALLHGHSSAIVFRRDRWKMAPATNAWFVIHRQDQSGSTATYTGWPAPEAALQMDPRGGQLASIKYHVRIIPSGWTDQTGNEVIGFHLPKEYVPHDWSSPHKSSSR